jgi:hypothetical protein
VIARHDFAAGDHAELLKELAQIDTGLRIIAHDDSTAARRIADAISERKAWTMFRARATYRARNDSPKRRSMTSPPEPKLLRTSVA